MRHGTVTEFEPPTRVTFHQPMTVKPRPLGIIDIVLRYTFTPTAASVHVGRVVTLTIHWPLKLIQPLVVRQFRRESGRTLLALKAFAETLTAARGQDPRRGQPAKASLKASMYACALLDGPFRVIFSGRSGLL